MKGLRTYCGMSMLFCVTITACATTNSIRILPPEDQPKALAACIEPFPTSAFRAVHTLSFTFSGSRHVSFIGVTVVDQAQDRIRSVLVSPEGVTMFDAIDEKGVISILRCMLPGDAAVFANGLFEDVRFMFFRPVGETRMIGRRQDGRVACRLFSKDMIIEVVPSNADAVYELKRNDHNGEPRKILHMHRPFVDRLAKIMTLQNLSKPTYSLALELLEDEPGLVSDDVFSR